ncbi:alpha/beta fold hydrolase [Chloroflexia bacterium SDU3-3]|nr:alpha/beta fold hydrolase [Chloroflexia bacterium SDU3-3]
MKLMFQDQTLSFEFLRVLGETVGGGADINECLLTGSRIVEDDLETWFLEWNRTAERIHGIADRCMAEGHPTSARDAYLRASNYYRSAEFFLHIGGHDPRAEDTYDRSRACFLQALPLLPFPAEQVQIPYEGTTLPGYLFRPDNSGKPRPTILRHGGFDSTGEEIFFHATRGALERGYNCLLFEGPGQGYVLRKQGLPFRPDWENVVTPVVDFTLTQRGVDPARLVLIGGSLGGYLAPRAAAFEHRLAACVAIDGLFSFDVPAEATTVLQHAKNEQESQQMLQEMQRRSLNMRWAISQGIWSFAVDTPEEFVARMARYTMEGIAQQIRCPMLVCDAERDHFFDNQPQKLYDALTCERTLLRFTAEDGADEHCHVGADHLLNQRVFDWLDSTLA